jgi:hypothetical protein
MSELRTSLQSASQAPPSNTAGTHNPACVPCKLLMTAPQLVVGLLPRVWHQVPLVQLAWKAPSAGSQPSVDTVPTGPHMPKPGVAAFSTQERPFWQTP